MSEDTAGQAVTTGPKLLHTGTYALYETPAGGVHVVWRRTAAADPGSGELREVEGAPDEHMPDIPPEALPLVGQFMQHGIPPAILAILQGRSSPLGLLRQLGALNGHDDGQEGAGDGDVG